MLLVWLAVSVLVTNLGYGFAGSFTRLGEFRFTSNAFAGQKSTATGNRFAGTGLGQVRVPFPKDYVLGLDVQRKDLEHCARPSYLAGEFKDTGWWYYYLYALAIKAPLGVWGLLLLTIALRCRGLSQFSRSENGTVPFHRPSDVRDEVVLLSPAILLFAVVSSHTGFSEHLRYVLPAAPMAFIWISQLAVFVPAKKKLPPSCGDGPGRPTWRTVLVSGLLAWFVGSSLWVYPHSLSYFNELAGGPTGGHAYLLGSNVDWGQDLRYLKWWLDKHPDAQPLYLAFCGRYDPVHLGLKYSAPPACQKGQTRELAPGRYAISVNFLRGFPSFARDGQGRAKRYGPDALSGFLKLRPVALAGTSIYIYQIEEVAPCRHHAGLVARPSNTARDFLAACAPH